MSPYDPELVAIADYVLAGPPPSELALATAHQTAFDALGCAMLALSFPECTKLLGPEVAGADFTIGARVPGTPFRLTPVRAAFNLGSMIRWLDFNDTWLAAEWGHPSDNLGGILMAADWYSRNHTPLTMAAVLTALVRAHEIQGILALENSFNGVGLDHVLLVRVATAATATALLGGTQAEVLSAVSNAFIDGGALRTYRHAPNTGSRKSWAAGDATARGVQLALWALAGEMGYPSALSAPAWGFYDVLFGGKRFQLPQPFASYVMENVLFKVLYPAEFHAQTAVEAAMALHPSVKDRLAEIERIEIETQAAGARIIDKQGPLANPADRDHCIQYMVAVPLIFGRLTAQDYLAEVAQDPRIDALRAQMKVRENPQFTQAYFDPDQRAIPNSVQVFFADGSQTERIQIDYPLGHRFRRPEAQPFLLAKLERNLASRFPAQRVNRIITLAQDPEQVLAMPVTEFVEAFL